MTHAIIIRMHYPEGDPRFEWRLAYFQAMVLPRLLGQTDQNFDIAVRCYAWQEERIKSLSKKIITFRVKDEFERVRKVRGKKYFVDFAKWEDVEGLKKYDIQSGLDSDDLVSPKYIETIHRMVDASSKWQSLHISFQPRVFDAMTFKTGDIGVKYSEKKGSAFMSIYQPNKENYRFVYEESHLRIGRHFDKSIIIGPGFCWATVHGNNFSTKLKV